MAMPGRNIVGDYRYDYQGQEKDKETGLNAFELRMYDSRINRWLSPDPKKQYHSPYLAMGNNWVNLVDPDGGFAGPCDDPASDCYQIEAGDTFWDLENLRGWVHGTLEKLNAGVDPTKLQIGQQIKTPHHLANFSEDLVGSPLVGGLKAENIISIKTFTEHFEGSTYTDITTEAGFQFKVVPKGPKPANRYVFDPGNSAAVIDMRHMLVIGQYNETVGNLVEWGQTQAGKPSGGNPQDYYSNDLGFKFFDYLGGIAPQREVPGRGPIGRNKVPNLTPILNDEGFVNYIDTFLKSPHFRSQ